MAATTPPPAWRLFLALWPSAVERDATLAHAASWAWPAQVRRAPADRLHVTLHFIGAVEAGRVPALADALATRFEPVRLAFDEAEVWPGGIAVLRPSRLPASLEALHGRLGAALDGFGLPPETRPYKPHVTLARKAQGAQPPAGFAPVGWQVNGGYALVRSLPGGAGYRTLRHYPARD